MKKAVLRYGAYAGIAELVFFILTWLFLYLFKVDQGTQGIIGYISILCPMIFVYLGIRYYRDVVNNGFISFGKALKTGLLIVIIPTISFAIVETIYVEYINPGFYETVLLNDSEQYRKTLPPEQFAAKLREMHQHIEAYKNPFSNFIWMILEIGSLGSIVVLISALLLQRRSAKVTLS